LRQECFIPTSEDWSPNFDAKGRPDRQGHYVLLKLAEFPDRLGYRVSVWGADDRGMEHDFLASEVNEAQQLFELVRGCGPVNMKDLKSVGFVYA
jgi:hypothetical protein